MRWCLVICVVLALAIPGTARSHFWVSSGHQRQLRSHDATPVGEPQPPAAVDTTAANTTTDSTGAASGVTDTSTTGAPSNVTDTTSTGAASNVTDTSIPGASVPDTSSNITDTSSNVTASNVTDTSSTGAPSNVTDTSSIGAASNVTDTSSNVTDTSSTGAASNVTDTSSNATDINTSGAASNITTTNSTGAASNVIEGNTTSPAAPSPAEHTSNASHVTEVLKQKLKDGIAEVEKPRSKAQIAVAATFGSLILGGMVGCAGFLILKRYRQKQRAAAQRKDGAAYAHADRIFGGGDEI